MPLPTDDARAATLFLCGDVMTGRGIDQILAHPGDPTLCEPYVTDAGEYVALAEADGTRIPRHVRDSYVWGDAIEELARRQPKVRIANLETSITRRGDYWPDKGIHYRMHPDNVGVLTAARLDVCAVANNHVLDFGFDGLRDTLDALAGAGIKVAGAGVDLVAAQAPASAPLLPGSRVLTFAFGTTSSGVPDAWAARPDRLGVNLVADLSEATASDISARMRQARHAQDVVVASIHWGGNWGYEVPQSHRQFAHWLIDGGVDVIHGHSSHHPRPVEFYRGRLILYGCGDFLNDYEGITGYESYRDDLTVMYFPTVLAGAGDCLAIEMVPMRIKAFRLHRASPADAAWMAATLARISEPFGTRIERTADGLLTAEASSA